MLLPYRVKNPVKRFPIATCVLIGMNVLIYACTTDSLISIRDEMLLGYGFAMGDTPVVSILTSMFLHADPFHLLGNMLFLWIFGPPVEDRLRNPRYLALYLAAGIAGALLHGGLEHVMGGGVSPDFDAEDAYGITPLIGASGCIMGVLGAYWYLFPWSTVCVFYWLGLFARGVFEVAALWVIGIYLLLDLAQGLLSGAGAGVAYFAHVGGGAAGILLCLALRAKRDTGELSEAKAIQADAADLSQMPLHALQAISAEDPGNPRVIRAIIGAALRQHQGGAVAQAMVQAGPTLIDKDPALVAHYLTDLRGQADIYQPAHLLRLAGILERAGDQEQALGVYRAVIETHPAAPDVEAALYRMAVVCWDGRQDAEGARNCIRELGRRFPHGEMVPFARALWQRIR